MKKAFVTYYVVSTVVLTIAAILVVKKNQENQDYYRLKFDEYLKQNQNSKEER